MVIRIHGRDTGGLVSAVESHDMPGGGPPPHIHHREDETFQVLEGEYEWTVGGKTFIAKKGATIFGRETPIRYRFETIAGKERHACVNCSNLKHRHLSCEKGIRSPFGY